MDLRDNQHDQLEDHIKTLNVIAALETPAPLIWIEIQRILSESATHLKLHMLPHADAKKPYLDLRTGATGGTNTVAEYVGATSQAAAEHDAAAEAPAAEANSFMPPRRANGVSA